MFVIGQLLLVLFGIFTDISIISIIDVISMINIVSVIDIINIISSISIFTAISIISLSVNISIIIRTSMNMYSMNTVMHDHDGDLRHAGVPKSGALIQLGSY